MLLLPIGLGLGLWLLSKRGGAGGGGGLILTEDHMSTFNGFVGFAQGWNALSQTVTPLVDYNIRQLALIMRQFDITRRGNVAIGIEDTEGNTLWQTSIWSPNLPDRRKSPQWLYLDVPSLYLYAGDEYRIVIHTVPVWQWFNGSMWVNNDSVAAVEVGQGPKQDYPRGDAYYGYNYIDHTGTWQKLSGMDLCFEVYK